MHTNRSLRSTLVLLIALSSLAFADRPTSTVPEVGVRDRLPSLHALTNATVVTRAGETIPSGTVVIDKGVIVAVGQDVEAPAAARVIDMNGRTIYPALVEPYFEIDTDDAQPEPSHWNKHVRPERSALASGKLNGNADWRKAGFALRVIVPKSGILKGTSAVVTTGDRPTRDSIVAKDLAQHLRLTSPRGATREYYPNSPMGAVALARQTFYDADWYTKSWRAHRHNDDVPRPEANAALEVLGQAVDNDQLFLFEAPDEQYVGRAHRFAIEFGLQRVAIRGSGHEYELLDAISAMRRPMIIPVNFPKAPNVATPEAARDATLYGLMHWHFAPENPARLRSKNVAISLTTHGLKKLSDFRSKVREAVERGLSSNDALHACTLGPATLYGFDHKAGSIEVGKGAHFVVTDGDWLDKKTKIVETWVDGERFQHEPDVSDEMAGIWKLSLDWKDREELFLAIHQKEREFNGKASLTLKKAREKHGDKKDDETESESKDEEKGQGTSTELKDLEVSLGRLSASFSSDIWDADGTVRLSGTLLKENNRLIGRIIDEQDRVANFVATRVDAEPANESDEDDGKKETKDAAETKEKEELEFEVLHPLGNYGLAAPHEPETAVIENATIWTCGPDGILENASLLIEDGMITRVGKNLAVPVGATRIDAKGKHVTPGIIDCHSHMATDGGVNEATQAITAEVRIGDFINAFDMTVYQQLAGGVTAANILHGSANPIGGQNQVIKLRWGKLPEELKFTEAPQGIKFALGENVKQSNWGDEYTSRYPQSRLGVEQLMRDALIAAKEYERQWAEWKKTGKGIPPRKDLELDALLEIVNGERWIHCHSYRQDEILALMRTLESFDITIGTFQHILEGYKVAKEMAEHGAMASSFADWWAYKFEVFDAIPFNGALLQNAGVVVSFNSDDAELGRHLNHDAAKAVKYGGVPREEALKFVTLNPAKQLRIDEYVGSLEAGKHADLVIWNGDPLQVTSRCEQTWVDGTRYFDIERDGKLQVEHETLRQQLIRRVLDSGKPMKEKGEKDEMWRDLFPNHDEYCGHGGHGHDH